MLSAVHVMGAYWHDDTDAVTALGRLVAEAKDQDRADAPRRVAERFADFAATLDIGAASCVAAVPPAPGRDARLVPALAQAAGDALGLEVRALVRRAHMTPRVRDLPPDERRAVVEAGGYVVTGSVVGARVVLVDDVILTGTTLGYLAELLCAAGAERVVALVACRTRRR